MYDTLTIAAIASTFLLAGTVKGVIGLGLPTVSLAILTVLIDIPSAMALLLLPYFVTNFFVIRANNCICQFDSSHST